MGMFDLCISHVLWCHGVRSHRGWHDRQCVILQLSPSKSRPAALLQLSAAPRGSARNPVCCPHPPLLQQCREMLPLGTRQRRAAPWHHYVHTAAPCCPVTFQLSCRCGGRYIRAVRSGGCTQPPTCLCGTEGCSGRQQLSNRASQDRHAHLNISQRAAHAKCDCS